MKMSILIPMALALGLTAVLAPAPADAACYGPSCYTNHYQVYRYPHHHRHWNRYWHDDYRQWREYGGLRHEW